MIGNLIRVLIVDDNKVVRRAIRMRLEQARGISVIGEAGTGIDGVRAAIAESADVVLMDLHLPGMDGIDATRTLLAEAPNPPKVILLTSEISDRFVVRAVDAGAVGYLLKNHEGERLVEVIRGAMTGTATISPLMAPRLLRELSERRPNPPHPTASGLLTPAETRVVSLLARGVTANGEIAKQLSVSTHTVRSQAASAMRKTGTVDRTQLALWAIKHGLDAAHG